MSINIKKNKKTIIVYLLFLIVGFAIGIFTPNFRGNCSMGKLKYINKNLICENTIIIGKQSYISLKNNLQDFIEKKKTNKELSEIAVYFRDLQNGPTLGINEHMLFSPASLLKLPLLLSYENLKNQKYPDLFDRKILAQESPGSVLTQTISPKESIEYGKEYKIGNLLENMIKYSDNKSYYVLSDYLMSISPREDLLKQTFIDLGIVDPKDLLDNTISVKSYGSIFVQLFNSSYFNKQDISDEVLTMLTEVDWNNGINKGVPANIEVAHKFGERFGFKDNIVQLHDCGIVYYPQNPYLLCVMTRGYDFGELANVIAEISKILYEEVDSRKL